MFSGPATQEILYLEFQEFSAERYRSPDVRLTVANHDLAELACLCEPSMSRWSLPTCLEAQPIRSRWELALARQELAQAISRTELVLMGPFAIGRFTSSSAMPSAAWAAAGTNTKVSAPARPPGVNGALFRILTESPCRFNNLLTAYLQHRLLRPWSLPQHKDNPATIAFTRTKALQSAHR